VEERCGGTLRNGQILRKGEQNLQRGKKKETARENTTVSTPSACKKISVEILFPAISVWLI